MPYKLPVSPKMLPTAVAEFKFQYLASLCMVGLFLPVVALAQGDVDAVPALVPTPSVFRLTHETLTLPGSEKMSMIEGGLLFDVSDTFRAGIGSFGAVRGSRGGFITLGGETELRQRINSSWVSYAGLFVGAGGGRNANALTGGGLMLRGDVGVSYGAGRYGSLGFGVSHINFPSGLIRSTQPYVRYQHSFYTLFRSGWNAASFSDSAARHESIKSKKSEFMLVWRSYKIPSKTMQVDGIPQHRSMQLLGVDWESYLNEQWFLKLESAGAVGGKSNGYMQIFGGAGRRLALSPSAAIKLYAAIGPAGGGQVDTGGGLLLDSGISLQKNVVRRIALELSLGYVRAPSASFRAQSVGLKLNYQFELPQVSALPVSWKVVREFEPGQLRVLMTSQTYLKAHSQWRSSFVEQQVSNLGIQLDYFVTPQWFLSGRGLAAYSGKAGGYMTGQVGVGRQSRLASNWFIAAEALLGAAGGGGLAVGSGLVGQVNGVVGYRLSDSLSLMTNAGRIESRSGNFKANVVGLSLGYQLSWFMKKIV